MIIKVFGQLQDIIGSTSIEFENADNTNELVQQLQSKYSGLKNAKYKIAVNRDIIQSNTILQQDAEVALLPPFSGG